MGRLKLKTPVVYIGGKRRVADAIWARLGNVNNYIEPFVGSAACLLARPHEGHHETINDFNGFVANFWRATRAAPEKVAEHADWPVNEVDLQARHLWMMCSTAGDEFRNKIRIDPDYYDAKIAGWWVWGQSMWIGTGWCQEGAPRTNARPQLGDAFSIGRGVHGNDSARTIKQRREWLTDWMNQLSSRLRQVRVCCGDWKRVCDSPTVTTRLGLTGIFLDPPYALNCRRMNEWFQHLSIKSKEPEAAATSNRAAGLYGSDLQGDVDKMVAGVLLYCVQKQKDPQIRIALAGYDGEHNFLEKLGWSVLAWKSSGYGNRSAVNNNSRERIWFSPSCVDTEAENMPLFQMLKAD